MSFNFSCHTEEELIAAKTLLNLHKSCHDINEVNFSKLIDKFNSYDIYSKKKISKREYMNRFSHNHLIIPNHVRKIKNEINIPTLPIVQQSEDKFEKKSLPVKKVSEEKQPRKKPRRRFSPEELYALEEVYDLEEKITRPIIEGLSDKLGLPEKTIRVWFYNKRRIKKGELKKRMIQKN